MLGDGLIGLDDDVLVEVVQLLYIGESAIPVSLFLQQLHITL